MGMRRLLVPLLPGLLTLAPPARVLAAASWDDGQDRTIQLDREETQAYLWSAGGFFLPLGAAFALAGTENGEDLAWPIGILGVGAVTVGPSIGQFKAGAIGHGIGASAMRGAGEAIAFISFVQSLCIMCDSEKARPSPWGGMLVGGALYLAGTAYSLINIHQTYDAKREAVSSVSTLRMAPTLVLDRENRLRPGAALSMTF
jgi:hypothetical protein